LHGSGFINLNQQSFLESSSKDSKQLFVSNYCKSKCQTVCYPALRRTSPL